MHPLQLRLMAAADYTWGDRGDWGDRTMPPSLASPASLSKMFSGLTSYQYPAPPFKIAERRRGQDEWQWEEKN